MNKIDISSSPNVRDAGLRRYAALGLGTAVLAGMVTTTDASVSYTNYNGLLLTDTDTTDTLGTDYSFDFNGDGTNDITFSTRNEGSSATGNYAIVLPGISADGTTFSPINVVGKSAVVSSNKYVYPSRLTSGTISAARAFITLSLSTGGTYLQQGSLAFGAGFSGSKWTKTASKSGYLGFSFTLADGLHYGFIGMTVGPQALGSNSRAISIGGIGYETTPNTAITVSGGFGAVPAAAAPEPSSVALVALGGLGLAAYRRKRAAAAV